MRKKTKKRRGSAFCTAAVILLLVIAAAFRMPDIERSVFYPTRYSEYVDRYAELYGLDKYFVYAVIKTESNFDPNAESEVGARGLMQLMEDSFDWVKYRMGDSADNAEYGDMYDPEVNIRYGTYLLKLLVEEYGRADTAAAAYHTGRGNVNSWLCDSRYSSDGESLDDLPSSVTRHYVNKVMTAYEGYTNLYSA